MLWKIYLVIVAILAITSLVRGMFQTPIVWQCIFVFSIIWTLTAVFVLRLYEEKDEPLPFIFKLIGIIPTFPLYYGLYQYAF
ncbi:MULTISPECIES: hypothetical protein [Bacillus]|uniref:hypothetical protein n=1 Tax=Bacillus TaxID=1386 RepID=UPI0009927985|nr:hypothetical protein [Bacillus cereus]OOQ94735.1 hypothetical protein BW898_13170 [Bacillus cereus]